MTTAGIFTENLTKTYPGAAEPALQSLNLNIAAGEVYGFLGSNGAGKSTTIRLLLNFLQPTAGRALIQGKDSVIDSTKIKQHTGYLAGDVALYPNVTGHELLDYLGRLQGLTSHQHLHKLAKRFECELDKPIGKLSKGNRQKIGILQAFMHQPSVLILDEPTSGLDPLMQERFYETALEAKARGATIFLSSHSFSEVEHTCDRVGIIKHGQLVREGTLEDFALEQAPTLEVTFKSKIPTALQHEKAAEVVSAKGRTAVIKARGSLPELLGVLSKYDVVDLQTQTEELEEEFLSYYQEDSQ